jgi:putative membrane protein
MIDGEPYAQVKTSQLILRDVLAADRTALANERTFLAYVRTSLTLLLCGVSIIRFFDSAVLAVIGWALLPLCPLAAAVGLIRYRQMGAALRRLRALESEEGG